VLPSSCITDLYDSNVLQLRLDIHPHNDTSKGYVRATAFLGGEQCWSLHVASSAVTDTYLETWVQELVNGTWTDCAYTYAGWFGAVPGVDDWNVPWNCYMMQDGAAATSKRTIAYEILRFTDSHTLSAWAYTASHTDS